MAQHSRSFDLLRWSRTALPHLAPPVAETKSAGARAEINACGCSMAKQRNMLSVWKQFAGSVGPKRKCNEVQGRWNAQAERVETHLFAEYLQGKVSFDHQNQPILTSIITSVLCVSYSRPQPAGSKSEKHSSWNARNQNKSSNMAQHFAVFDIYCLYSE